MSLQVEKMEKNMAKLTIEVSAEEFGSAVDISYKKNRGKYNIPGFRKGKAPRKMIEKTYGVGVFYEDAANEIIPDAYEKAANESELEIVAQPEIDVVQIENGKPFIFTAVIALKPKVTLGEYKNIEVKKANIEVTEDEIKQELDKVRDQNARIITIDDRDTEEGDIVTIDFEGFVEGEPFEGGSDQDFALTLGSHTFVDNFEDQLIGKKVGEELDVNVTFPEDYRAEGLRGKPALFKVSIKEIKMKELPELNDDFAQDVTEFETLADYKEDIKNNILEKKEEQAKKEKEETIVEKIVENAKMDIPEQMVDTQLRQMTGELSQRIQSQGLTMEQYMQFTGMTPQKIIEGMKPQALKRIQSRLVLEEIVKAENIVASEEDIQKEIADMAESYKMEKDKMVELIGEKEKKQIAMDMAVQKAVDFVVEGSIEK